MKQGLRLIESALKPRPVPAPVLLITLDPWHKVFIRNLLDLFRSRRQPSLSLSSPAAPFWTDVFVTSHLPWGKFGQSIILHTALIAILWTGTRLWPQASQVIAQPAFQKPEVIYYEASEYLPPLDTGSKKESLPQKGDPEHSPQAIISVPPEPDNRKQTIVAPPELKLDRDVPMPNVVAWDHAQPTIPMAAIASRPSDLKIPELQAQIIAPPPEVSRSRMDPAPSLNAAVVGPAPDVNAPISRRDVHTLQAAVIEPPPSVETASTRRLGDINIGRAQVVSPAPQLPVGEQHSRANRTAPSLASAAVVPPPPSIQGTGVTSKGGRLIALNIHPAQVAPVEAPNGNRRGSFAATPDGKVGAAGTPKIAGSTRAASSTGGPGSQGSKNGIPSGLLVGPGPKSSAPSTVSGTSDGHAALDDPPLLASASPPRTSATGRRLASELSADAETEDERKVFAGRRSYGMTLSIPNLNSSGGSWVMHFSELSEAKPKGDLIAPVATHAVDPGYPLELMRRNVQGTVTLSAVINSEGRVADVKVVNGIDDQLDAYARAALLHWQFLPALRNGNPVPLQAVVMIPFRPMRKGF
ncbi:MAG: TonB family protein [Terriglobales bacterium]